MKNKFFEEFNNAILFKNKIHVDKNIIEIPTRLKSSLPKNKINILGTTIVLGTTDGNILHFQNEWFYNFYVCLTRAEKLGIKNIDNIVIIKENNHIESFVINSIKKYENRIINYEFDRLYQYNHLIFPLQNRELIYRENNKTLWPEIRENLFNSYGFESSDHKNKVVIHNDTKHGREILNIKELIYEIKKNNFDVEFINGSEWFKSKSSKEIMETYHYADFYISPWGASFGDCKIAKKSCKLIILKAKCLKSESWYFKDYENDLGNDWSIEHIHTNDFNQKVFVVDCDWEKWQNPLLDTAFYLTVERTANLIVNVAEIINILRENQ